MNKNNKLRLSTKKLNYQKSHKNFEINLNINESQKLYKLISSNNVSEQNNWYKEPKNKYKLLLDNWKQRSQRTNANAGKTWTADLWSLTKLIIAYLWLYFLGIPCLFIGIVFVDVPTASSVQHALLISILFITIGSIFFFIDFIFSILLAIAIPAKTDGLKSVDGFDLTFIFFIIGIFINLFSMIAAFIFLSKIKKMNNTRET